ncbi:MAG: HPP family protein [Sphingomonadaceae bacterium]|nr:HPP family protein [Sphingomonadaceae bacterium]
MTIKWRPFRPLFPGTVMFDRLLACVGAAIGIGLTVLICARFPVAVSALPLIVAPIGASAVLVFAVPASPLAQPWPVVGGNIISTLVGVACARLIPDVACAAGVAVGAAILVMYLLRCLHPPGGAAALTAVIGGPAIHAAGYAFAFIPVGINSIAIALLAMVFHRCSGHSYPHRPSIKPADLEAAHVAAGILTEDIDSALADLPDSFDISRDDLDILLTKAELHAIARRARR